MLGRVVGLPRNRAIQVSKGSPFGNPQVWHRTFETQVVSLFQRDFDVPSADAEYVTPSRRAEYVRSCRTIQNDFTACPQNEIAAQAISRAVRQRHSRSVVYRYRDNGTIA